MTHNDVSTADLADLVTAREAESAAWADLRRHPSPEAEQRHTAARRNLSDVSRRVR